MTFWWFFTPSILRFRERLSHEKDLEDPDLSESAIKNRAYCIVCYLSIVCSLKGTGLPSACDIGLTDTFFLPLLDTFGRGQCCIRTSRGWGQSCITIKVQRCIRYTLLVMFYYALTTTYIHKVLQFLRNSYVDLVLAELVTFGHLGLGPAVGGPAQRLALFFFWRETSFFEALNTQIKTDRWWTKRCSFIDNSIIALLHGAIFWLICSRREWFDQNLAIVMPCWITFNMAWWSPFVAFFLSLFFGVLFTKKYGMHLREPTTTTMKNSSRSLRPLIKKKLQTTNHGDHGGWGKGGVCGRDDGARGRWWGGEECKRWQRCDDNDETMLPSPSPLNA